MLSGDDFAAVLKSRERSRSLHFSLQWRTGAAPISRLGLVLPKKLARTSVRRNLIKRQSRTLFRVWSEGRMAGAASPSGAGGAVCDVVLKITAKVANLDRRAQFGELSGLMQALPRV
jgi:RNase P protein component